MSELQVVEPADILVPLDRPAAEKLDGRIRRLAKQAGDQLVQVGKLLDEARSGRIHEALGFSSWTAYVSDTLGGQLQLSGEARVAMVALMAGEGMSLRAIAAATGVSKSTVDRDLAQVSHDGTADVSADVDSGVPQRDTSEVVDALADGDAALAEELTDALQDGGTPTVTGMDGKTYKKPKRKPRAKNEPAPEPEPPVKERRPQLRIVFRENVDEMVRLYQETHNLHTDPRWKTTTFSEKDTSKLLVLLAGIKQLHGIATKQANTEQEEKSA